MNSQEAYERWPDDPSEGLWIKVRDWATPPLKVANFVPEGFEAYARIFHPLKVYGGRGRLRWSEVADIQGVVMHPQLQIPELLGITDTKVTTLRAKGWKVIHSPGEEAFNALGQILRRHTASLTFLMGIWEGSGTPDQAEHQTLLELPGRNYFLVELPFDKWSTNSIRGRYETNLFWPKDRAWFISIDIDAGSTYVGGTTEAIADIVKSPDLESAEADLEDTVLLF